MNIPLNIDWQQILLHMLNFAILTLGLYLLLYNPVRNYMHERTEKYKRLDIEAEEKLKNADELAASYNARLNDADVEINNKKENAAQEAQQAAEMLLQNAKQQAAQIIEDAKAAAQLEREKILEDTQKEIAYMAIAATEKLLIQSASGALDQFLAAAKKE